MPLRSKLFRGDSALEACLVRDPAHVLLGATGDHVGKIHSALVALDRAQFNRAEWSAKKYGPSTAATVLAYKKKRRIINFSYQTQADDIVGKMTIAALDKEMLAFENRSQGEPRCGDPVGQRGGGIKVAFTASGDVRASPPAAPRLSAKLRIIWQPTAAAVKEAQNRALVMVPKANEILRPLGMEIVSPASFPDATVPNNNIVDLRSFGADILNVRQDADKQRSDFPDVLRVIACPFVPTDPLTFAITDGGTAASFPFLRAFKDFILINVRETRPDQLTLLHEMIHAATGLTKDDHDLDPSSVFAESDHRSVLRDVHAEGLSKAFFAGSI